MKLARVHRRTGRHGHTLQQCPFTASLGFGNRLRNQRLESPYYHPLKSATKVPSRIDFACLSFIQSPLLTLKQSVHVVMPMASVGSRTPIDESVSLPSATEFDRHPQRLANHLGLQVGPGIKAWIASCIYSAWRSPWNDRRFRGMRCSLGDQNAPGCGGLSQPAMPRCALDAGHSSRSAPVYATPSRNSPATSSYDPRHVLDRECATPEDLTSPGPLWSPSATPLPGPRTKARRHHAAPKMETRLQKLNLINSYRVQVLAHTPR